MKSNLRFNKRTASVGSERSPGQEDLGWQDIGTLLGDPGRLRRQLQGAQGSHEHGQRHGQCGVALERHQVAILYSQPLLYGRPDKKTR